MVSQIAFCVASGGKVEEFPSPSAAFARIGKIPGPATYFTKYDNPALWAAKYHIPQTAMRKKILFFDFETTGLPASSWRLEDQPRVVQLWWILAEFDGSTCVEISRADLLFNPGIPIPKQASDVHGKTDAMVAEKPPFSSYFSEFVRMTKEADHVCGHNVIYDFNVLNWEADRIYPDGERKAQWKESVRGKLIDTMHIGTDVCKLPGKRGYKWPKLQELHKHLFGMEFSDAHDAMGDIEATAKCFEELVALGHAKIPA